MRRKRSIIALGIALVLLIGAYVFLINRPKEEETPEEVTPTIDISRFDREKIKQVTIINQSGEMVFNKKMVTVEVEDAEGNKKEETQAVWENTKPYPVKLDQTVVSDLTRTFASLSADQLVEEDPADLSIYGLKDPVATGTVLLEDNSKVTLYLGNRTAVGSTYYLMKEGDPKVYTVWSSHGDRLNYSLKNFRDKKLTFIDRADMRYLLISKEGQEDIEIVTNEEQSETQAQFGLGFYRMVKPFNQTKGIDTSKLDPKLQVVDTLTIKEFVDDNPADLSVYGLDNPKMHFILKDSKNTLELFFGNKTDNDEIYFKTADSDAVYTMDAAQTSFMDIKPMEVIERFALIINIEDVDKVVLEGRGETHTLSMTRKTEKAKEEGKEDEVITTYFLDGEEKPEKAFKGFYQSLIGVLIDAAKDNEPQGEPEVTITYYLNKGPEREMSVSFVPYDRDFYSVVRDGRSEFLTSSVRLDWLYEDLVTFKESKLEK